MSDQIDLDMLSKAQNAARVGGLMGIGPNLGQGIGRIAGLIVGGCANPKVGARASKTSFNGMLAGCLLGWRTAADELEMHKALNLSEANDRQAAKEALAKEVSDKKAAKAKEQEPQGPVHVVGGNPA